VAKVTNDIQLVAPNTATYTTPQITRAPHISTNTTREDTAATPNETHYPVTQSERQSQSESYGQNQNRMRSRKKQRNVNMR
jgi:hypothetical protein